MKKEIEEYNSQLPKSIGDGLTEERIEFDSDGFNFVILCDEDLVSMDLLNEHREEIKSKMIQDFKEEKNNGEGIKVLEEYCKKSNKNYSYLFVGNTSGKKVKITVTPEEL